GGARVRLGDGMRQEGHVAVREHKVGAASVHTPHRVEGAKAIGVTGAEHRGRGTFGPGLAVVVRIGVKGRYPVHRTVGISPRPTPPAIDLVGAGRAFADHRRVAGAVRNMLNLHAASVGAFGTGSAGVGAVRV